MNTKKWTIGFIVAIVFGLLTAGAGLAVGMTWQAFAAVLCTSLVTQLGGYLMKHPIDEIEDENEGRGTSKENSVPPFRPPLWVIGALLAFGLMGCANADRNIYRLEVGAGATVAAAHKGYAVYWRGATNNPDAFHTTSEALQQQRATVDANTILVGASLEQVDNLRLAVRTNTTVGPALQAAIVTLAANASNINATVTAIIKAK